MPGPMREGILNDCLLSSEIHIQEEKKLPGLSLPSIESRTKPPRWSHGGKTQMKTEVSSHGLPI